ncbi:MAG TPA: SOS response-associated peptidase, partial [Acidimicrobiales bacterium]
MCGRFVSATPPDQLAAYFGADVGPETLPARYNVAPTNDIWAVVETATGRRLEAVHWGLVPSWAKDVKLGQKMINARAETLLEKNVFKAALKRRRCLVPVDGFYEWKAVPGRKAKQPYYIHRSDGEPLAFAGLWETWRDPAGGSDAPVLHSATIVTVAANA